MVGKVESVVVVEAESVAIVVEAESVAVDIVSMSVGVAVSLSVSLVVDAKTVAELAAVVETDSDAILAAGSEKTPMEVAVDDAESDVAAAAEFEDAVGAVVLTAEDDPLAIVLEAKDTEIEPLAPTEPSAPSSSSPSSPESLPSSSLSSPESLPSSSPASPEMSPGLSPVSSPESSAPEGGTTALMGPVPAAGAIIGATGMKTRVTFRAWAGESASKAFADDARKGGVVASVQSSSRPFTMS